MKTRLPWDIIDPVIERTLQEDLGEIGDITSPGIIPEDQTGKGEFVSRESGIAAGIPLCERIFNKIDPAISCSFHIQDGSAISPDTAIGMVEGPLQKILTGERTALNFLQRLSGIATMTSKFVQAVRGTKAVILDTRKTTPQLRFLEKYAVCMGGGQNHRFGLFDMVMIKDNHIDAAGSITKAVSNCIQYLTGRHLSHVQIEVETRTLEEVRESIGLPVQRIMLDNMDLDTMRLAVVLINGKKEVEASGNVSLETVRRIADTGVDFISIGSLTHSVKALDISLQLSNQ